MNLSVNPRWRGKLMQFHSIHTATTIPHRKKITSWTVNKTAASITNLSVPSHLKHAASVAQAGRRWALAVRLWVRLLATAASCSLSFCSGPVCVQDASSALTGCLSALWRRAAYQSRDALQKRKLQSFGKIELRYLKGKSTYFTHQSLLGRTTAYVKRLQRELHGFGVNFNSDE